MQLLTFTVAGQTYAIESRQVVEVLPLVPARPLPRTPDFVRGIFTYRGRLVPLVDLGLRLADAPPAERLSTRVIVVRYQPADTPANPAALLGLVAEHVVSICGSEQADIVAQAPEIPDAGFLGRLLRIRGRTIQVIDANRLLPPEFAAGLFPRAAAETTP
ncbi:MAG: chemotaxis protein CheW [Planctomycetia bacterium]|jgi:chemotaxis-related protein WspB